MGSSGDMKLTRQGFVQNEGLTVSQICRYMFQLGFLIEEDGQRAQRPGCCWFLKWVRHVGCASSKPSGDGLGLT
jgi:hypothetical protein